jgi:hypothetical protein
MATKCSAYNLLNKNIQKIKTNQTIATALAKVELQETQIAAKNLTLTLRQQFFQLPKTKGLQELTWENNLLLLFLDFYWF